MHRLIPLLAGAALLCACSPDRDPIANDASPANVNAPAPPAPPTAPSTIAAPADAPAGPALAVEGEGLRLFDRDTGAARPLSFGTAQAALLGALRFRGPPGTGTNGECGAGPLDYASWPDGLTLYFQKGTFFGWALGARAANPAGRPALATAAGIGPGSSRADLDDAYAARIMPSTLGTEFAAGDLFGLLDGPGPYARISNMWAGASCNMRQAGAAARRDCLADDRPPRGDDRAPRPRMTGVALAMKPGAALAERDDRNEAGVLLRSLDIIGAVVERVEVRSDPYQQQRVGAARAVPANAQIKIAGVEARGLERLHFKDRNIFAVAIAAVERFARLRPIIGNPIAIEVAAPFNRAAHFALDKGELGERIEPARASHQRRQPGIARIGRRYPPPARAINGNSGVDRDGSEYVRVGGIKRSAGHCDSRIVVRGERIGERFGQRRRREQRAHHHRC